MVKLILTDSDTLHKIQKNTNIRYYINQDARFGKLKEADGNKVQYIYFQKDDTILGFAVLIYYQYKKFFLQAKTVFGPCFIDDIDPEDFLECLLKIKSLAKKTFRCISFLIWPNLHQNIYNDIEIVKENVSYKYLQLLKDNNFKKINHTIYDSNQFTVDTIYTKNIENMSYDDIISSISPNLRTSIKKSIKDNVKVRTLSYDELEKYIQTDLEAIQEREFKLSLPLSLYQKYYKFFGDDVKFFCAYINCDESISSLNQQIIVVENNQKKLDEKYAENKNHKKYKNISSDNLTMISNFNKSINKLLELKSNYGNIIEISYSCHFILNKEFIYFTSCAKKEFMFLNGNPAIHSYAFKIAADKKLKYYNLLGCSGDTSDNAVDSNILKYKRSFNGNFEKFIGIFKAF